MVACNNCWQVYSTVAWRCTKAQAHMTRLPSCTFASTNDVDTLAWQCAGAQADLAFFPFGTIAHALTEDDALSWLRDASACLAPGGLVVLQMEHPGGIFDGALFEVRLLTQLCTPPRCHCCGCMLMKGLHRGQFSARWCSMSVKQCQDHACLRALNLL